MRERANERLGARAELFVRFRRQQLRAGIWRRRSAMKPRCRSSCIEGVAFWASRLPDWETARAVIRGERPPPGVGGYASSACAARADRTAAGAGYGGGRAGSGRSRLRGCGPRAAGAAFGVRLDAWRSRDQRLHVCDAGRYADADLADQVSQFGAQRGSGLLEHRNGELRALHGDQRVSVHVRRRSAGGGDAGSVRAASRCCTSPSTSRRRARSRRWRRVAVCLA